MNEDQLAPPQSRRAVAVGQLAVSVLLWSLTGVIIKMLPWDGWSIGFGRGVIAVVVMALILRGKLFTFRWLDVAMGAGLALNSLGFILASKWGPVANAIVLVYAAPVYSALFTTFWHGQRLPWYYWPALAVVLAGIILMVRAEMDDMNLWATGAGLVSGVALSVWVECRRHTNREGGDRGLFYGGVVSLVCLSPFFARACVGGIDFRLSVLLGVVVYSLIIIAAYLLFSRVVQYIPPTEALLISSAEVPLMAFWAYVGVRELPPPGALIGGILIFLVTLLMGWKTAAVET